MNIEYCYISSVAYQACQAKKLIRCIERQAIHLKSETTQNRLLTYNPFTFSKLTKTKSGNKEKWRPLISNAGAVTADTKIPI